MGACGDSQGEVEPPQTLGQEKVRFRLKPFDKEGLHPLTSTGLVTDFIIAGAVIQVLTRDQLLLQTNFVDEEFPASQASLSPREPRFQDLTWQRLELLFPEGKLFEGRTRPADIKQGLLGDCYFLSALISMSQQPESIERLFQTKQRQTSGCYAIWLNIDGQWTQKVVDSAVPVLDGKPAFTSATGEFWVALLEKAYAKAHGSYFAIEGGLYGHAISCLTGAPYDYLCLDSDQKLQQDSLWTFITQALGKKYMVGVSSQKCDRSLNFNSLVASHSYSVLEAREVVDSTGKSDRILKLMNPWGEFEWKGKWSDRDSAWTEVLAKSLKLELKEDGVFWINAKDLAIHFGQACRCLYHPNYTTNSLLLHPSREQEAVLVHVDGRTHGFFILTQHDHRLLKGKGEHLYSNVKLVLTRLDDKGEIVGYSEDVAKAEKQTWLEATLQPGTYCLCIEVDQHPSFDHYLCLSYYGQNSVGFAKTLCPRFQRVVEELIPLHPVEKKRQFQFPTKGVRRSSSSLAGYVYYHYLNESQEVTLCEMITLKEITNLELVGRQAQGDAVVVYVDPGQSQTVLLKVNKEGRGSYSLSAKFEYWMLEPFLEDKLRAAALKNPTKVKKREVQGKQVDVEVRFLKFLGGMAILYQNNSKDMAFTEEVKFELSNLRPHNFREGLLVVEVGPGQQRLLLLRAVNPKLQIQYKMSVSFYVSSPEFQF